MKDAFKDFVETLSKKEVKKKKPGKKKDKDTAGDNSDKKNKKDPNETSEMVRKKKKPKDNKAAVTKKEDDKGAGAKVESDVSKKGTHHDNSGKGDDDKTNERDKKGKKNNNKKDEKDIPTDTQKVAFEKFVKEIVSAGVDGLLKEYTTYIKTYLAVPLERKIFDSHPDKNRYKDVICNDVTRVVLSDGLGSDYIHANHIKGEPFKHPFICTQGPMAGTVVDFWRMIVSERVPHIVMLCDTVEFGKTKCQQYWPLKEGDKMVCGGFTIVTSEVTKTDPHVTRSTLEVETGAGIRLQVKHHHWISWPDKSVPKSLLAVFRVLRYVKTTTNKPVVVHCSAGIGRTGTLVCVEGCLQRILSDKPLSLLEMCRKVRDQRMHSVQVEVQYIFIAAAMCEYGRAMGYWNNPELLEEYLKFKLCYEEYVRTRPAEVPHPPKGSAPAAGAAATPAATPAAAPAGAPATAPTPTSTVTAPAGTATPGLPIAPTPAVTPPKSPPKPGSTPPGVPPLVVVLTTAGGVVQRNPTTAGISTPAAAHPVAREQTSNGKPDTAVSNLSVPVKTAAPPPVATSPVTPTIQVNGAKPPGNTTIGAAPNGGANGQAKPTGPGNTTMTAPTSAATATATPAAAPGTPALVPATTPAATTTPPPPKPATSPPPAPPQPKPKNIQESCYAT